MIKYSLRWVCQVVSFLFSPTECQYEIFHKVIFPSRNILKFNFLRINFHTDMAMFSCVLTLALEDIATMRERKIDFKVTFSIVIIRGAYNWLK